MCCMFLFGLVELGMARVLLCFQNHEEPKNRLSFCFSVFGSGGLRVDSAADQGEVFSQPDPCGPRNAGFVAVEKVAARRRSRIPKI